MKVAFVDDDERFVNIQKEHLTRAAQEINAACEVFTFSDGLDLLEDYGGGFDILFLDVEMPHLDGLETARRVRRIDQEVCIIFMTNMARYAIQGYEVDAVDFVVKPVGYFTFLEKFKKAVRFCSLRQDRSLVLAQEDGLVRVSFSGIYYLEKEKNYLVYHTEQGEFRERGTMALYFGAGYAVQHITYGLSTIMRDGIHQVFGAETLPEMVNEIIFAYLVYILAGLLAYWLLVRPNTNGGELRTSDFRMLLLSLTVLGSSVVLSIFVDAIGVPEAVTICRLYAAVACTLGLVMQFSISHSNRLERDNQILEYMLRQEKQQHEMSKENIDIINIKCHDLKYQIAQLEAMDDQDQQRASIQELEQSVMIYDSMVKTGCDALDPDPVCDPGSGHRGHLRDELLLGHHGDQLGRGERVETAPEGASNLDLKFYDTEVDNLDQMTDAVALAIAEEGEVLMKNNGVLPLAKGSDVTADVEGSTIYGTGYSDGTAHQLALSEDEKDMIRFAKANCSSVVVILNTSNVMEISELAQDGGELSADAILWVGGPGAKGFEAMGNILSGQVNPSGKTVDIWMTDLMENPSTYNFGNYEYDNTYLVAGGFPNPVGDQTEMNFLEYEENVYVGYRYYETADDTGATFTVFGQSGRSYDDAVVYPFGYGLNYGAEFEQTITSLTEDADSIHLTVRVTNNGTIAGKDVVQVYYNPPYTDFDAQNGIEKSTVNLIAFDKTGGIAPGSSETVELTIAKEDMASYSYTRDNGDGTTGAYVLEAGDYVISINRSSHEEYESRTVTIDETVWYDNSNPRQSEIKGQSALDENGDPTGTPANPEAQFIAATNNFQSMSDHMVNTNQLTRANGALMNTATTPTAEDKANVPAYELTTDSSGRQVLAQTDLATNPNIGNSPDSKIYVPESEKPTAADFTIPLSSLRGKDYYDPMWNDLLDQLDLDDYDLYVALTASYDQTGEIASVNKPATVDFDGPQGIVGSINDATEYTAWPCEPIIAATFNTDLTYDMGEAVGKEAASAGVNTWYAPAANIHRSPFSGRNFEYYSEDPVLSGYMLTAEVEGCSSQGLITTIKHFALNDEECYDNDRSRVSIWANEQTIRTVVKNMCYSIVNSRAFDGVAPGTTFSYKMSPWRVALYTGDAIAAAFIVVMIVVMVLRTKKAKEHPELFQAPKAKKSK